MKQSEKTREQLIRELEGAEQRVALLERAASEYKQVGELYDTLANSSPVGVYIYQDGRFCFVNSQFQKMLGYTESELLSMNPGEIVYPEDRQHTKENATRMLKGYLETPYEFRVTCKDY